MSKTAPAKTNGHPVDAINAVAQKAAARPLPKKAPARTPVKAPVKAALKAPVKAAAKPAPKAPAKPAAKSSPPLKTAARPAAKADAKPSASKAASKPAAKAASPAPKSSAKGAPKAMPKTATKTAAKATPTPKAGQPAAEREKTRKPKLVRDSFTMPEEEYAVLALVKKACLKAGFEIKKSELLRVGVVLISQIDMATLKSVLASLPQLKTGRPKSS